MNPEEKALVLAELREDEVRYRRHGRFESAVQSQRAADYLESGGGDMRVAYPWFDRGIDRMPDFMSKDGIFGMSLPNGLWFYAPKDVAYAMWAHLTEHLQVTREEFMWRAGKRLRRGWLMEGVMRMMDGAEWIAEMRKETE